MRVHLPATSFIGYFKRRSPWACSRAAAPLAQCAPKLKGLSQPGSWPIQTPFCTSAMMVQPTEQCVHTDFLISILPPPAVGAAASAFCTRPVASAEAAARPPMARPELRKNVRRSTAAAGASLKAAARRTDLAAPFAFFLSIAVSFPVSRRAPGTGSSGLRALSRSEPCEFVVALDVFGLLVEALFFLLR